jgi:hypothetical protein
VALEGEHVGIARETEECGRSCNSSGAVLGVVLLSVGVSAGRRSVSDSSRRVTNGVDSKCPPSVLPNPKDQAGPTPRCHLPQRPTGQRGVRWGPTPPRFQAAGFPARARRALTTAVGVSRPRSTLLLLLLLCTGRLELASRIGIGLAGWSQLAAGQWVGDGQGADSSPTLSVSFAAWEVLVQYVYGDCPKLSDSQTLCRLRTCIHLLSARLSSLFPWGFPGLCLLVLFSPDPIPPLSHINQWLPLGCRPRSCMAPGTCEW